MGRRRKKKKQKVFVSEPQHFEPSVSPDVKKSIVAVCLVGVGFILALAIFNQAGPFGKFVYGFLSRLLGIGYYILPPLFVLLALRIVIAGTARFGRSAALGALIFVLASLGMLDVFLPEKAGLFGKALGILELPLGVPGSSIIFSALIIISGIMMLNIPLKFTFSRKEKDLVRDEEEDGVSVPESVVAGKIIEAAPLEKETEQKTELKIKEPVFQLKSSQKPLFQKTAVSNYVAPPLSLLKSAVEKPTSGDLRANSNIIRRTLESFGISVEMGEINIGPKFTRYTLKPAEGVKLSRITALSQDLALSLAAHPIRIEAPIPGKSLVGVEVPNKAAAIVRLGSLMSYPEFVDSGKISVAIGRDVNGDPIFASVEKMPHLLVAGATGSGKSIVIHSFLMSLLFKNSPATLRLILVDPKKVEMSLYKNLPHLLCPVITESKKAIAALRWAIKEMERRYETLMSGGCRDIQSYNKRYPDEAFSFIVIVIDELADLMAAYGREVEGSIVRLAQMARAVGIHLIVSTQRPSVEVVTGLIKANITSRIALQLPSQVDSRTILDTSGAEKLLGGGDMLYVSSAFSKPRRIQGAFVSEEEISGVTEYIRENNKDYSSETTLSLENGNNGETGVGVDEYMLDEEEEDELLEEAIRVVKEAQKASASLLQRRLKVGYARAARLLDIMEGKGIVGPGDGAKPREVYGDNGNGGE